MPENESFIPGLSAVQYVSLAGRLVGMPARDAMARAHMVLNYAGIDEARYREIETYSTGMKQKVKLAQALVHHPELLILDEPTSGLDPRGRDEMLDLIRDLSRVKGIRVLLSTHILPDVERVCEDVLVMHRGKLVAKGRLDELTEKRGLAYEVRATGPVARFAEELATAGLGVERASEDGAFDDVELSVKLPEGAASLDTALILKAATAAGVELRHMAPVRSSLEALFRQLIVEAG
jgi:ABC-2 type transport system ATP-binding protein